MELLRILVAESAGEEMRLVAVTDHQGFELVFGDAGEDGRVGDLVAVEVQDRQDDAVVLRVDELVAVPRRRERAGLGLAVADDREDEEILVVEGRSVGVAERVPQLASFVDGSGGFRCDVARDATRE